MGPTILLQWSINQPPANLTDIIISRLLEHYSLTQPQRSAIYFRTYRSNKEPTGASSGGSSKLLTTIHYSTPSPILRETAVTAPRDDTTYLFLEDRTSSISSDDPTSASKGNVIGTSNTGTKGDDDAIETDGFEILNLPPTPAPEGSATTTSSEVKHTLPPSALTPMARGKRGTYRMLAVKPSGNVLPLLQNLLSPFVMGLTKSARAAASTTAQTSTPTPLPGTPYIITSLSFPALAPPHPGITITVHTLPSTPSSMIFIEAEYPGQEDSSLTRSVLQEVLEDCVPGNIGGETTYHSWPLAAGEEAEEGAWEGVERTRRVTMALARCLRETGYI